MSGYKRKKYRFGDPIDTTALTHTRIYDPLARINPGRDIGSTNLGRTNFGLVDTAPIMSRLSTRMSTPASTTSTATASGAGGGGMNFMGKANAVAPFVSNLANAFRKIPKPRTPQMEAPMAAEQVNYDQDRVDVDRQFLGSLAGISAANSNPGQANAVRASLVGQLLGAKGRIGQTERNTNAQMRQQANWINSGINARNVERRNNFQDAQVQRDVAQQQTMLDNISNAGDKYQMLRRDRAMMDLERDRLAILPRLYKDTGVLDRNLLDLYLAQQQKMGKRYGGTMKRYLTRKHNG